MMYHIFEKKKRRCNGLRIGIFIMYMFSKICNTVVSIAFNQYGCIKLNRNNFSIIMGQTVYTYIYIYPLNPGSVDA